MLLTGYVQMNHTTVSIALVASSSLLKVVSLSDGITPLVSSPWHFLVHKAQLRIHSLEYKRKRSRRPAFVDMLGRDASYLPEFA